MHVIMYKQNEDENFVWYKFEKSIHTGEYIDKRGRVLTKVDTKFGKFKFDKTKESIEIDMKETDPDFLRIPRTIIRCIVKLISHKRKNDFPKDSYCYACWEEEPLAKPITSEEIAVKYNLFVFNDMPQNKVLLSLKEN